MSAITIPKKLIKKDNLVVIPLKRWMEIEGRLEDLEMYSSGELAKEIKERRAEKSSTPLDKLLKKYRV